MKFIFKQVLKVSAFYLEKQKSIIPEKNNFQAVVKIKTKKLCLPTQFSGRVLGICTEESLQITHQLASNLLHRVAWSLRECSDANFLFLVLLTSAESAYVAHYHR